MVNYIRRLDKTSSDLSATAHPLQQVQSLSSFPDTVGKFARLNNLLLQQLFACRHIIYYLIEQKFNNSPLSPQEELILDTISKSQLLSTIQNKRQALLLFSDNLQKFLNLAMPTSDTPNQSLSEETSLNDLLAVTDTTTYPTQSTPDAPISQTPTKTQSLNSPENNTPPSQQTLQNTLSQQFSLPESFLETIVNFNAELSKTVFPQINTLSFFSETVEYLEENFSLLKNNSLLTDFFAHWFILQYILNKLDKKQVNQRLSSAEKNILQTLNNILLPQTSPDSSEETTESILLALSNKVLNLL